MEERMEAVRQIRKEAHRLRDIRRSMLRAAADMNYHPVDLQISLEEIAGHLDHVTEALDAIADQMQ
jgi:hypothetical protein